MHAPPQAPTDRWRDRVRAAGGWPLILLAIAAGALALRLSAFTVAGLAHPVHGFSSHYTAARSILEGEDVARFYDDAWFTERVHRFEPSVYDPHGANLPTMGLTLLPLAPLDYRVARAVWTFGSLAALLAVLAFLSARLGLGPVPAALLACFALAAQPVYENLFLGQMYVFVLALLTVAWSGFRRRANRPTGVAIGALLMTKTAALMLWPLLLARRLWRSLGWAIAVAALVVVASLPFIGAGAWKAYARAAAALPASPLLGVTAYQTQLGFFRHLFDRHEVASPVPLLDLPPLGTALHWSVAAALLATSCWTAIRSERDDAVFAAFVLLSLILSPVSLDYHYVVAILPVALLLDGIRARPRTFAGAGWIAGALLIAADLPYRSETLAGGAWALLAYPKLYGAVILWTVSVALALQPRPASDTGHGRPGREPEPGHSGADR